MTMIVTFKNSVKTEMPKGVEEDHSESKKIYLKLTTTYTDWLTQ